MGDVFPPKEIVEQLRKLYPAGTRVVLIFTDDEFTTLKPGDKGEVSRIDDVATTFINWDNGSGLGMVYGVDRFKPVDHNHTYDTGAEMWCDNVIEHGTDEASAICFDYIDTRLKLDNLDDELQFIREMFTAMFDDVAEIASPYKLVYPYEFREADQRGEIAVYRNSRIMNNECARAIDNVIKDSCYKPNHYNLEIAAMKAIHYYGFTRIMMVLARWLERNKSDGRFSDTNRQWAKRVDVPPEVFDGVVLNSHSTLINSFMTYAHAFYLSLHAERFMLPGKSEMGELACGYQITRSIRFKDRQGFAIGRKRDDIDKFVCLQFVFDKGKRRDFHSELYGDKQSVHNDFIARIIVYLDGLNTSGEQ